MKYTSIKICLVIAALFGGVAGASDLPDCPSDTNVPNNCFGTYTFSSGSKYVGEFKDGNSNGQGTYTWLDGKKYVGEFKDGNFNGQGTFTWLIGDKYVGEWKDGNYNGQGTYTWLDGKKYVGEYKDHKRNGKGTVTSADGTVEKGIWKDDVFQYANIVSVDSKSVSNLPKCPSDTDAQWHNCFGTFTWANGDKYVGEWKDNKKTGQGTFTTPDGDKYVGEWKYDKRTGQGTMIFSDGSKYVGEWKDGKSNGQGTVTYANGTVKEGIWKDHVFQYAKTLTKPAPVVKTPTQEKKYAASNARGAIIFGLKIGQSKPNNCRPKHVQFSRRFGLEQFKAYTCSVIINGESIRLVLNGINSPAEIIEIKRRQLFRNLDAYDAKDQAIKHYDNGDTKTSKAFYYDEYTFEYKNSYPSELTLKVGQCKDGDLGSWRHNCLSYIQYTARASDLGEIYDGLVAASKKKQKF